MSRPIHGLWLFQHNLLIRNLEPGVVSSWDAGEQLNPSDVLSADKEVSPPNSTSGYVPAFLEED